MGIHEDELVFVAGVGSVSLDAEDELAVGVVDGEAVAGEEEGGLEDGEMGFFFEDVGFLDNEGLFHSLRSETVKRPKVGLVEKKRLKQYQ